MLAMFLCTLAIACALAPLNIAFAADDSISGSSGQAASSQSAGDSQSPDPFQDAATVELEDGKYLIEVSIEGGSGRASVRSPAELEVRGGKGAVTLIWTSKSYDYMLVGDKKYTPVNDKGYSTFVVPVLAYDESFPVVGDTTAMSEAHEVDYTLTVRLDTAQAQAAEEASESASASSEAASSASEAFLSSGSSSASASGANASASGSSAQASSAGSSPSSSSVDAQAQSQAQSNDQGQSSGIPWPWIVFIVCAVLSAVAIGFTIGVLRGYRNGK